MRCPGESRGEGVIAPLRASPSLLCKLGSIIVHAEEANSTDGHDFDAIALAGLLADVEVIEWLDAMQKRAFLPVKRKP